MSLGCQKKRKSEKLEIHMQVQGAQTDQIMMDAKRPIPRHIMIEMPNVKDKQGILKTAREKKLVTYRGVLIRLSADFSKETLQARRDWQEIFKVMKSKTYSQDCSAQQRYHLELKTK